MEKLRVQRSPEEADGKSGQTVEALGFSGMPGPEERRRQSLCPPSSPSPFLQDQLLHFSGGPTPPPTAGQMNPA